MPVHVMTRKILRPWINPFTLPQKAAQNLFKPIKIGATQLRSVTKKWRRDNLSFYVWTEALSGMFFAPARELSAIERFHMTSRRPYWCPKTMKRPPCWCPKPVLWELNSFLMQTLSFVPINLRRCWPRERKHSIVKTSSIFNLMILANGRNIVGQQFPTLMLHAASVSTLCCMLLRVVGSCCAHFWNRSKC